MTFKPLKSLIGAGIAAIALSVAATGVQAAEYTIDPTHSFVEFKTKHLGYSWLSGRFNTLKGTMEYDSSKGEGDQKISLEIDTASIDTNHAERDKHLRSSDFLDVAKFPTATFVSTGYKGGENGGTLSGDLTLHGVTKNISFEVKKIGEGDDPWGGYRAGFEGSYELTRKDFNMGYNLGPAAETVILDLWIEAIRNK